jgi:acetyl esterase/lipase
MAAPIYPLAGMHWRIIATLIRRTGARVTVPLHGLGPKHTADDAYQLLDGQAKAEAAGTKVDLRIYPAAFHVFVTAAWPPEARHSLHGAESCRLRVPLP